MMCVCVGFMHLCSLVLCGGGGGAYNEFASKQPTPKGATTMTNAEIIANAKLMNGITEDAHTFAHWRTLGFSVRKGEHAAFSATIWKYAKGKRAQQVEDESGEVQPGKMFMKKAHFFTASQVERLALA